MSNRTSPVPREPLGKLVYRQDDLNSLKCLVAIRMSKGKVEAQPVVDKKVRTTLTLASGETLIDPFAIAWFLASYEPKIRAAAPDARVMQWQSFSNSEIRPFLQGLVKEGHLNRRDVAKANTMRKVRLISGLDTLNQTLKNNRFLLGHRLTLADALMAVDLTPILDPYWPTRMNPFLKDVLKKDYSFLREWFNVVRSKSIFLQAFKQFITGLPYRSAPSVKPPGGANGDEADNKTGNRKSGRRGSESQQKVESKANNKKVEDNEVDMSGLAEKPLRVLCLHGYRQNDVSFREKTGAFRKLLGKYCEFTFIKAPHLVLPMSNEDINQDQRGWWFSRENDYFKADDASDCDKGFDGSLDLIQKTFELHGPFDGVIGFSQGAALAALLCLIKTKRPETLSPAIKFDFAVMVAAFKSVSTRHAHWYTPTTTKVDIPTLHVMGAEDRVIKKPLSEDLLDLFEGPTKLYHPGGHFVPASSKQKASYYKFLHKVGQLRREDRPSKATLKDRNQNQGCDVKADADKAAAASPVDQNSACAAAV